MNEFTIDILLEFLYKKFAITFALCFIGAVMRKWMNSRNSTGSNNKKNLVGEVIMSAVFSTFLMCAVADYVNTDLHFEVYAILSIILGMWGLQIIKLIMDGKFIINLLKHLTKTPIDNSVIKSAVSSASDTLSEGNKTEEQQNSEDKDNKNE